MKKLFFLLISATMFLASQAQVKSGDADLDRRLAEYMQYTEKLNFEKLMDYMHPKLFKLAPKEALIAAMKQAFESTEMKMGMKDLGIAGIGEVFKASGSEYRKVEYKMTLTMQFLDTSVSSSPEFMEVMKESMAAGFPGKEVSVDASTRTIIIKGTDVLYAIKDAGKQWLFIGYKEDPKLVKMIFPQEVIDHYEMAK